MANSYKGHHWQKLPVTSQVVIEEEYQDAAKINDSASYRAALENVDSKKNEIITVINSLIDQMNSLKNHSETGALVKAFLTRSIKSLNQMVTQINTIQKNFAAAEDANYEIRIRDLEKQLASFQAALTQDQAVDAQVAGTQTASANGATTATAGTGATASTASVGAETATGAAGVDASTFTTMDAGVDSGVQSDTTTM